MASSEVEIPGKISCYGCSDRGSPQTLSCEGCLIRPAILASSAKQSSTTPTRWRVMSDSFGCGRRVNLGQ